MVEAARTQSYNQCWQFKDRHKDSVYRPQDDTKDRSKGKDKPDIIDASSNHKVDRDILTDDCNRGTGDINSPTDEY